MSEIDWIVCCLTSVSNVVDPEVQDVYQTLTEHFCVRGNTHTFPTNSQGEGQFVDSNFFHLTNCYSTSTAMVWYNLLLKQCGYEVFFSTHVGFWICSSVLLNVLCKEATAGPERGGYLVALGLICDLSYPVSWWDCLDGLRSLLTNLTPICFIIKHYRHAYY